MSIDKLIKAIPPPAHPVNQHRKGQRKQVETELGSRLPDDYWEFGCRYGSGYFAEGSTIIFNPTASDYLTRVRQSLDTLRAFRDLGYWKTPKKHVQPGYPVFPDSPGLLPWGEDENEGVFSWLRDENSPPEDWQVVLARGMGDLMEDVNMNFSTFLAKAMTNQLKSKLWSPRTDEVEFVPWPTDA